MTMINGYKDENLKAAYEAGGYRERYAMEHGKKVTRYENGRKLFRFTYSPDDKYQDANGATWSVTEGRWVG